MRKLLPVTFLVLSAAVASAQTYDDDANYPTRRALVANVCPAIKIDKFTYGNKYADRVTRFNTDYEWSNPGDKDVVSFELVILKFDPFNRSLIASRTILPGHNSATYKPLKPGEKDADGTRSVGSEDVFTAVAYVRSVRFADGTVWQAALADVLKSIKTQLPDIVDPGPLSPDPAKKG